MATSTVTPPEIERGLPASTRHGTASNPDAILAKLHLLLAEDAIWTEKIAEADANGEPTHMDDLIEHRADCRDAITELVADLDAVIRAGAPIRAAWLHAGPPASDSSVENRLCTVGDTPHAYVTQALRDAHRADADHVIGESVTAPGADGYTHGESITGVISAVEATTPDGDVIARLESGYRVTVSKKLVEMVRPNEGGLETGQR